MQSLANLVTPSPVPSLNIFSLEYPYHQLYYNSLVNVKNKISYYEKNTRVQKMRLKLSVCICICVRVCVYMCVDVTTCGKPPSSYTIHICTYVYTYACIRIVSILCTCHRFQSYLFEVKYAVKTRTHNACIRAYTRDIHMYTQ